MEPMKRGIAAAGVVALLLSGCGVPQAPAANTPTEKSSAQIASIIAELNPQLEKTYSLHFEYGKVCDDPALEKYDKDNPKGCDGTIEDVRKLISKAKEDLEASKPWPAELQELAARTVSDFDLVIEGTNEETVYRTVDTGTRIEKLRVTLAAWKPFGA